MSTVEWMGIEHNFLDAQRRKSVGFGDDMKLMVSLHGIEFSDRREGYWEVAPDIYFSNLIYLLYIKKVVAGKDFETVKERAKSVVIYELERKKHQLLADMAAQTEDIDEASRIGKKLHLLNKALSVLDSDGTEQAVPNCEIYEVS